MRNTRGGLKEEAAGDARADLDPRSLGREVRAGHMFTEQAERATLQQHFRNLLDRQWVARSQEPSKRQFR